MISHLSFAIIPSSMNTCTEAAEARELSFTALSREQLVIVGLGGMTGRTWAPQHIFPSTKHRNVDEKTVKS